jgi:hypothetical protein
MSTPYVLRVSAGFVEKMIAACEHSAIVGKDIVKSIL